MCDLWIATSGDDLVTVSQREDRLVYDQWGGNANARRNDSTYVSVQASALLVDVGAGAGGGVVLQFQLVVGGSVVQPQGFCVFMIA